MVKKRTTNDPYAGSNRQNLFSIDETRVTVKERGKKYDIYSTSASLIRVLRLRTYHLLFLSGLLLIVILYIQHDMYIARRMDKQLSQGIEGGIKMIKPMNHSLQTEAITGSSITGNNNDNITGFTNRTDENIAIQTQTNNNDFVDTTVTTDKTTLHNRDGTTVRHRNKTLNDTNTNTKQQQNLRDRDTHIELFANKKKSTWRVYKFPIKPLYNIKSILKESIGTKILNYHKKNPLRHCSPTVQFTLKLPLTWNKNTNDAIWTLQSMMLIQATDNSTKNSVSSKTGKFVVVPKTHGGDEIYVEWESDTGTEMGIAQITDMLDGTYQLKFIRPPILQNNYTSTVTLNRIPTTETNIQLGRLTIYYDYTCNIGSIVAPGKDDFRRAGEIHLSFTNMNVPEPFIHDFIPPNTIRSDVEGGQQKLIDLSQYHTVIAFGDSLMLQFVRQYKLSGFWSSNIIYEQNVGQCLSNQKDFEEMTQKFYKWHNDQIINLQRRNHSVAVIAGSAVWDAMRGCVRDDFTDHRNAIRKFITILRNKYPQIDLYWKSPSAIVLHRRSSLRELMNNTLWLQRSRYISDGVPRKIYHVQKVLMDELHVPFLDLFDAYYLSAPWSLPGDSRHYNDEISSLFLSYFWPGLDRSKVHYLKDNKQKAKGD